MKYRLTVMNVLIFTISAICIINFIFTLGEGFGGLIFLLFGPFIVCLIIDFILQMRIKDYRILTIVEILFIGVALYINNH